MSLLIEFRQRKIAAEIVFPEQVERSFANAFRFVFKSYMYHLDQSQLDYSLAKGLNPQYVNRNIGMSKTPNKTINLDLAKDICAFFNMNFEHVCLIAEKFVNNNEYNSMSFAPGKVIFIIAFHENFNR